MTRALIMAMHKYTPFGDEFYEPILHFQLQQLKKYQDEFDTVYFMDSNWNIPITPETMFDKAMVIRVNPHLRYYDAYKEVLPQIKEDLVLFMDNDMLVYKEGIIRGTFLKLEPSLNNDDTFDVVSIYDTCGDYKTDKLNGKNKFCPYWFATRKDLLMKYRDCEWGPNMPEHETLGKLTENMLADGIQPYEWTEDKSNICMQDNILFRQPLESKKLGYYHVRAGSTPAYLLATQKYGDPKTYWDYLHNQPKREYLRQCAWYQYMGGDPLQILTDAEVLSDDWEHYMEEFKKYHGL